MYKQEIIGLNNQQSEAATAVLTQKPNRNFLTINFLKPYLGIYTFFDRLGFDNLKNKIGEPPVVLDSMLMLKSNTSLNQLFFNKGYFMASSAAKITPCKVSAKRAKIQYRVQLGQQFTYNSTKHIIKDPKISAIYNYNVNASLLKVSEPYMADKLDEERNRIYNLMKENGYFYFDKSAILFDLDTNNGNGTITLTTRITTLTESPAAKVCTINSVLVNVLPLSLRNPPPYPTIGIKDSFMVFQTEKLYKNRIISRAIFVLPGNQYTPAEGNLTYKRLADYGTFGSIDIKYITDSLDSTKLNTVISLASRKRMNYSAGPEIFLNSQNFGTNAFFQYNNINIFKGAELFQLRLRGGLQSQNYANSTIKSDFIKSLTSDFFNVKEFSATASVTFPRFLFLPQFNTRTKYGNPITKLSLGYSTELRPEYQRRIINTSYSYQWKENANKSHQLFPIDINYVQSALSPAALEVIGSNTFLRESFNPHLSVGIRYQFEYFNKKPNVFKNYIYFKATIETTGNTLIALTKIRKFERNDAGRYTILGIPFYNYTRPEVDFRYFMQRNKRSALVFRINTGVGFAYFNSDVLPFERQFFVGGSNSVRAWNIREIGPGGFSRLRKDTINTNVNIEQVGDFKLEGSVEYRFDVFDNFFGSGLKGAIFTDYGNVWELRNVNPQANTVLNKDRAIKELAIGTGAGLRLDYTFFIFRFDLGLKVRDPQFEEKDRWVIKNFGNRTFTQNNNNYKFLNFNIGIGYPF